MKHALFVALFGMLIAAQEPFRIDRTVWEIRDFNRVVADLYGSERFSAIQKDPRVEVIAPKHTVDNPARFTIGVRSPIAAKSVALVHSGVGRSLIAFFKIGEDGVVNYELSVRYLRKGTLFAVVEGKDGKLYYNRAYLDVPMLGCAVGG